MMALVTTIALDLTNVNATNYSKQYDVFVIDAHNVFSGHPLVLIFVNVVSVIRIAIRMHAGLPACWWLSRRASGSCCRSRCCECCGREKEEEEDDDEFDLASILAAEHCFAVVVVILRLLLIGAFEKITLNVIVEIDSGIVVRKQQFFITGYGDTLLLNIHTFVLFITCLHIHIYTYMYVLCMYIVVCFVFIISYLIIATVY
ncbi:hypothetical protein RFI_20244 [Reticulomyxa filosa]|uniref:Uncharacterized protein n=1 Tax=Reticulomyxa filosa TaxID=46433 RepID=X6MTT9_RETFI|nr:hypothetical protein RFI_20244 [Reticulomyxa filosa]|eukprot:ETO17086.1 hypothetical protein RFI_20244 [Reticulomyxa filosa]